MSEVVQPWRVDQLMKAVASSGIDRVADSLNSRTQDPVVQQLVNGLAKGLGEIVHAAIDQHPGIPKKPLNAIEIAQAAGILPRKLPGKARKGVRP